MTKHTKLAAILIALATSFSFFSCSKDDKEDNDTPSSSNGYYVLCEGVYGQNNSALDFYDLDSSLVTKDIFQLVNATTLGETANDMTKVKDETVIALTGSSSIVFIDSKTTRVNFIMNILDSNNISRQPRHLISKGDYIYVSCFDGNIVKVNANTKEIVGICNTAGRNPEGLTIVDNKLFVTNSGGLSYPNYDNSVSVINLNSFTLEKKIDVHANPTIAKTDGQDVYVLSFGDYSSLPVLTRIDGYQASIKDSTQIAMSDFAVSSSGEIYYIYNDYSTGNINLKYKPSFSSSPQDFENIPSTLKTPYHIGIINNTIYVTDAKDYTVSGEVFLFNKSTQLISSFSCSINPNKLLVR